ncbi:LysM domain-containing protein [Nocardia sp. NPDC006630]|uniref:LysM peptidoglycan-binding domain-containing protein n=1 Tax=Nocardia sp. NPDC006630 TaxID=3157181 RepID=UPI0033AC3099
MTPTRVPPDDTTGDLGSSLATDDSAAGFTKLIGGATHSNYMVSPNGLYAVEADSAETPGVPDVYKILGPDGKQTGLGLLTPPAGTGGHIDIGNDGKLTLYATAGTDKPVQSIASTTSKPQPGECTIVNSSLAPAQVQAAITDAQQLTQNMLGQFGSKKPAVVTPYPLTAANYASLDSNKGDAASAYNTTLGLITAQEATFPASDKDAIAASAKMAGANDKYYNEIIGAINDLNSLLRPLMPPDPNSGKFDATNTDTILSSVTTAMGTVDQSYQGYIKEVAKAAADLANSYTVKPGDNLTAIGAAHGETWEQLYAANRKLIGADPNEIDPGQKLALNPPPAPAAPPAKPAPPPVRSNGGHVAP